MFFLDFSCWFVGEIEEGEKENEEKRERHDEEIASLVHHALPLLINEIFVDLSAQIIGRCRRCYFSFLPFETSLENLFNGKIENKQERTICSSLRV